MKRLTATQALKVLLEAEQLIGDLKVFGKWSYMEHIIIQESDYIKLQEMVTEALGNKRNVKKPYFSETYLPRPYWYDVPVFHYRRLFEDIYGEDWYYDGGDLVRGSKTIVHYKKGMTMEKLINEVQTKLSLK
jgi:hypothetical protein